MSNIYNESTRFEVLEFCHGLLNELKSRIFYYNRPMRIEFDDRKDIRSGKKHKNG